MKVRSMRGRESDWSLKTSDCQVAYFFKFDFRVQHSSDQAFDCRCCWVARSLWRFRDCSSGQMDNP